MKTADEAALRKELEELRGINRRLQRRLADKGRKEAELVEAVHQAAKDAATVTGRPSPVKPPRKDRRRGGEVALLHTTDWQLAKKTVDYDTDVCRTRVLQAVEKTVRLTEIQRAAHPVDEAAVMLGGDLVEGVSIFPGQPFEVSSGAFEQVFAAARLVADALLTLSASFRRVDVYEVYGNHGRMGRKGDHPRGDNLDRLVCELARGHLQGQDRITWHTPDGWHTIVEIGAYRALLVHGDQIKSFGGNVPAFGIMRKATAWSSGVVEPFTDVWLGHFHNNMLFTLPNGGVVRVTGSTESGSEYAREFVAAKGRPSQRLAFVDPDRGRVTADYILWLD